MKKSELDLYWTIGFLVCLWLPLLESLLGFDPTPPPQENRTLAGAPEFEFTTEAVEKFPEVFEKYYDDHFGARSFLIRWNNYFKYYCLGVSPNPEKVILGKEGFFFEGGMEPLIRNLDPFSEDGLEDWAQWQEYRTNWLAERGVKYLLVIVPEAWTIYPELLPDSLNRVHEESKTAQLVKYLQKNSKTPVLDLTATMLEEKGDRLLYRPLDPHWNQPAGFIASGTVASYLKRWFPAIEPLKMEEMETRDFLAAGGYLNRALSLPEDLLERHYRVLPASPEAVEVPSPLENEWKDLTTFGPGSLVEAYEKDAPELPSAIVFHDSFGNYLIPYLSENFRRVVWVRNVSFSPEAVRLEKPDLVIVETAERNIKPAQARPETDRDTL
jgi:hypothetical protein